MAQERTKASLGPVVFVEGWRACNEDVRPVTQDVEGFGAFWEVGGYVVNGGQIEDMKWVLGSR
jgi:hypothetical protein